MAEREATWALLLAAVLALAVATWFAVRYLLLRRSLRRSIASCGKSWGIWKTTAS